MPIIVNFDRPSNGNPVDHATDGFDPEVPYQMIPLGGTRELVVQTGDFKAELNLTIPDISSMSNFRILRQTTPNLSPLPGRGVFVRRIALPERSVVQFTLSGRAPGMTVLEARDRPGLGVPPLKPDFQLQISVKASESRRLAVCYVFDRINRDTGARLDFATHLEQVHRVFHDQANFSIVNVDGPSASTLAARTVTLNGTCGKVFNLLDNTRIGRMIDAFDAKFPGVFGRVDSVVFSIPVPLRIKTRPKVRISGFNFQARRKSSGRIFSLLLVGPSAPRPRPKEGGPRPSATRLLQKTLAHEMGHALGLAHDPAEMPPEKVGSILNPIFFQPHVHNLMFPNNFILSDRLNGAQVEIIHLKRPEFRVINF